LFGNTLVEGMAYGLPVVATACAGPKEIITHPSHGQLVPIGNEAALTAAIERAVRDPGDPAARRQRAEDFSLAARVPAYEALISEVLTDAAQQPRQSLDAINPAALL